MSGRSEQDEDRENISVKCECARMADETRHVQLSFPIMQVTFQSGFVFLRRTMSTQYWSCLVLLSQEQISSVVQLQLSAAQQTPSAVQQNKVDALETHHPAWMSHEISDSRQGHPRYTGAQQWQSRRWSDQDTNKSPLIDT